MFFGEKIWKPDSGSKIQISLPSLMHTLAWVVFLSLSLLIRNFFLSSLRSSPLSPPLLLFDLSRVPSHNLSIQAISLSVSLEHRGFGAWILLDRDNCPPLRSKAWFFGKDLYCRHLILKFLVELEKVVAIGSFERCEVIDR